MAASFVRSVSRRLSESGDFVSNQAIFYEQAVPLNPAKHANWRLQGRTGYEFSRGANCVPVMAVEFLKAGRESPLVFLEQNDIVLPVGLLGLRQGENLSLSATGEWNGDYVPAHIRRYPFIFAASPDGSSFTLCIDESYVGFSQSDAGDVLFEGDKRVSRQSHAFERDFRHRDSWARKKPTWW